MVFEDLWSVPLGSPLAGIGSVVRTSSILGASLSLVGFSGAAGGWLASAGTPLATSISFPFTPGYSDIFGGLLEEGRAFLDTFFFRWATSEVVFGLELSEDGRQMALG